MGHLQRQRVFPLLRFITLLVLLCAPSQAQQQKTPQALLLKPGQTILLFGDSITAPGDYGQVVQDALDSKYPQGNFKVLSRGRHGDTAQQSLSRLESDIIPHKPDWVMVNFGVNDVGKRTPAEFEADMIALLERLRTSTKARLVIMSPVYPDRDQEDSRFGAYLPIYHRLAMQFGAVYAPLYETMGQIRPQIPAGVKYAVDGSHPNDIGHEIIGQALLQAWGYLAPTEPRELKIPALLTSMPRSNERVRTYFSLPLPCPVNVTLTELLSPTATASRAANPIVLDGNLKEWQHVNSLTLQTAEQRIWGVTHRSRPHITAQLRAAYDDNALYLAIEVKDRQIFAPAQPTRVIDRDWVELCFDLRPAAERTAKPAINLNAATKRAGQIIISAPGEIPATLFPGTGDASLLERAKVAGRRTKAGYNLEVQIPASAFPEGRLPSTGVGFDWGVVDVPAGDYYLGATGFRWTGSGASSFSTREFGTLNFLMP